MKRFIVFILLFAGCVYLLFAANILWKSPSYYETKKPYELKAPIMDMDTYMNGIVNEHPRPYIYTIPTKRNGKIIVLGVEHLNDKSNAQFDSIRHYWNVNEPDVALVEGRMGFFCSWIHDPIEKYGESGLTSLLAKKDNVELFTWEPNREDEIKLLIQKHSAKRLAMFYSLRPFFGIPIEKRKNNPEDLLQKLIVERTDYSQLKSSIKSWKDIDSIWRKDFPDLNWRSHNSSYGWPGYFQEIWNSSNLSRDEHMIQIILEQIEQNKTVFITMGSSHAPRIEKALKATIK